MSNPKSQREALLRSKSLKTISLPSCSVYQCRSAMSQPCNTAGEAIDDSQQLVMLYSEMQTKSYLFLCWAVMGLWAGPEPSYQACSQRSAKLHC